MDFHIELFSKHSGLNEQRIKLLCDEVKNLKVDGAIVECGVMNGGSLAAIAYNAGDRTVWGFDSWEGCPKPGKYDYQIQNSHEPFEGMCKGSIKKVEDILFGIMRYDRNKIRLCKGWVEKSLEKYKKQIGRIAFLHIDVDFYKPTKFVLNQLYDQVALGGWVVCDDYNYWAGCNRAVHEFVAGMDITLERPTTNGVWWRKK